MTHQEAVESLATERYLLDDMPNSDRQAFEDHFFSCDLCDDDMRVAAAMFKATTVPTAQKINRRVSRLLHRPPTRSGISTVEP